MNPSPGYFDLQVNGYAGIDFNQDDLTAEGLHTACKMMADHGVEQILATIITEHVDTMCKRLANLVRLREKDELARRMIPGLHIEGPFINEIEGYRGAHPVDAIRPADEENMRQLLDAAGGLARLVTLAPERDAGLHVTRMLAKQGIVISAGHTDASLDHLRGAIDAGLTMFTHVGNGCPMKMHRHDNIIQRVLSLREKLWLCFIADGAHVPFVALGNYLRAAGIERSIVVTDAIAAAGLGPGRYKLGRWDMVIGEDMVARAPDLSHLVGSACPMPQATARLRDQLHLSAETIHQLTVVNPRRAMVV
jgi:N-acetylglucosamine-6-phosphate deacetylase